MIQVGVCIISELPGNIGVFITATPRKPKNNSHLIIFNHLAAETNSRACWRTSRRADFEILGDVPLHYSTEAVSTGVTTIS